LAALWASAARIAPITSCTSSRPDVATSRETEESIRTSGVKQSPDGLEGYGTPTQDQAEKQQKNGRFRQEKISSCIR
jgi:hypothetical protein